MKKIIFCFLVCVLALSGKSATTSAVINGMLVDATDTTGLASATVKLMTADKQGHRVAGVTTDSHGVFNIKDVKQGRYIVQFSYLGYDTATRRVVIGADGRDVNLGMVKMSMTGAMLDEVVVSGVKTPITVKEDTIEFNADTHKTQANAVVEDLLKRLPGVEVGSDGKITANGKSVTKILIDGKEFFSDDPTVASKNIPANMVNKLQVIDRKSDLARLTGVDDGEDETVINLTVKKDINNGWFGTVNAGYGTHSRYEGSVMANYFNNGNQYTLMGGANNTGDLGFSDGGAMRFRRFGGEDDGVTKSQHLGFNFNIGSNHGTDETETFRAGGDVLYSHIDRDTRTATARQYLFAESNSYYNSNSTSRDKGHNLRGDFRLKWHPDSANTLEFRPNFSFNFSESSRIDSSMTLAANANLTPVNSSLNKYYNDGKSYELGGNWCLITSFCRTRGAVLVHRHATISARSTKMAIPTLAMCICSRTISMKLWLKSLKTIVAPMVCVGASHGPSRWAMSRMHVFSPLPIGATTAIVVPTRWSMTLVSTRPRCTPCLALRA